MSTRFQLAPPRPSVRSIIDRRPSLCADAKHIFTQVALLSPPSPLFSSPSHRSRGGRLCSELPLSNINKNKHSYILTNAHESPDLVLRPRKSRGVRSRCCCSHQDRRIERFAWTICLRIFCTFIVWIYLLIVILSGGLQHMRR